jgi:hypothetical protein
MQLKQIIYQHFLQQVNEKIFMLQNILADLKESSSNETKSTAGDKHETALAMLQMEQKNIGGQLQEALLQKHGLEKINTDTISDSIINGSLVKTNRGYFFISIALGKAVVEEKEVMAISSQSPLGHKMMGLKAGSTVEINNFQYGIDGVE